MSYTIAEAAAISATMIHSPLAHERAEGPPVQYSTGSGLNLLSARLLCVHHALCLDHTLICERGPQRLNGRLETLSAGPPVSTDVHVGAREAAQHEPGQARQQDAARGALLWLP